MENKKNKPDFSAFTISFCENRDELALKEIEYNIQTSPAIRIRNTVDLIRRVFGNQKTTSGKKSRKLIFK